MNLESVGSSGALVRMPGFPAGGNSTLVYFHCADCAVEESRVEAAGGKIQRPKMSIGDHGFISLVIDTEGNMIGLHSRA
jgi:predicted enzyme related to lactoylglutathione lyase